MNIEDEEMLEEYLDNCLRARNSALHRGQLALFVYYQGEVDIISQILADHDNTKKDEGIDVA